MLAVRQILPDGGSVAWIGKEMAYQTIQSGCESGDCSCEHKPVGAQDTPCLEQRTKSLASLGQVVERTEQEYGVGLIRSVVQLPCVSLADTGKGTTRVLRRARLLQVERHGVDQVHRVTACGEPARIVPGTPANVQHDRRRRR